MFRGLSGVILERKSRVVLKRQGNPRSNCFSLQVLLDTAAMNLLIKQEVRVGVSFELELRVLSHLGLCFLRGCSVTLLRHGGEIKVLDNRVVELQPVTGLAALTPLLDIRVVVTGVCAP